ncbi:thymidine kinase 2, mitochondrial-like [Physella acuta]|uniref:thymidine kinase 2, mitochondrial-like n=1 Tax=Physella acuta TaxID=109671 RepID=UPI0027DC6B9C|nr:thymidine kinase 2, mitochondrial-like [Physella acuta]
MVASLNNFYTAQVWRNIQARLLSSPKTSLTLGLRSKRHQPRSKNLIKIRAMNLEELKEHLPHSNKTKFTIAVEGNIGSGKTTLLQHFQQLPYCQVIGEPLDKWTDIKGHNALALLYEDSERWSFTFNMFAQLTRVQMHNQPHNPSRPIKMLERSLYSTRYCFVQNSYLDKTINGFEYSVLNQWFDYLVSSGNAPVDLIVYLRASPENCYERLKKRCRREEVGVPFAFVESLHKLYDDWLLKQKFPVPAPVLLLDANFDLDTMKETFETRRQEILCGYS